MKLESDLRISLVTMNVLKKKRKDTKWSVNRKSSLVVRTKKMVARILRRNERKVEDVLGEDQFGLRRGRCNWDAENNIRTSLDIDEELRACFIDS
jgi:hypothetical protein